MRLRRRNGISRRDLKMRLRRRNGISRRKFIVLKLPKISTSGASNKANGVAYVYTDSLMNGRFIQSTHSIQDTNGAILSTINTIFSNPPMSFARILYNDQPPTYDTARVKKIPSDQYGHSKGALAFDVDGGFWMIHSAPRFPELGASDQRYPDSATKNGQSFICVSFDSKRPNSQVNSIAHHLRYVRPFIFDFHLPPAWTGRFPDLDELLGNINRRRVGIFPPRGRGHSYTAKNFVTSGSQIFQLIGKNKERLEITDSIVRMLNAGRMFSETWLQSCPLPDWITVTNLKQITIARETFSNTKDHSKYLVQDCCQARQTTYYVCIGGSNRAMKQMHRGGEFICLDNRQVWESFSTFINQNQNCGPRHSNPC
eukprot:gene20627-22662_t